MAHPNDELFERRDEYAEQYAGQADFIWFQKIVSKLGDISIALSEPFAQNEVEINLRDLAAAALAWADTHRIQNRSEEKSTVIAHCPKCHSVMRYIGILTIKDKNGIKRVSQYNCEKHGSIIVDVY